MFTKQLTITKLGKERMLKMADFLDTLKNEQFDITTVQRVANCGTVGCIMGWAPSVFPELVRFKKQCMDVLFNDVPDRSIFDSDINFVDTAARLFEIERDVAARLTLPNSQKSIGLENLAYEATPQEAAQMLRKFIEIAIIAN